MRATRQAAVEMNDQYLGDPYQKVGLRTEVTKTLSGKGSSHHTTTNLGGSKFGGDDGGKWVVTADSHTHLDSMLNRCSQTESD